MILGALGLHLDQRMQKPSVQRYGARRRERRRQSVPRPLIYPPEGLAYAFAQDLNFRHVVINDARGLVLPRDNFGQLPSLRSGHPGSTAPLLRPERAVSP